MVRDVPGGRPGPGGASSRCRAGVRSWSGSALPARRPVDGRDSSCGHDVTTSTLRGPADGRQRQSTGNGGVRDWMWSPPRVLGPGLGRGAGAALSWGTNGGCWVGRTPSGQLRVGRSSCACAGDAHPSPLLLISSSCTQGHMLSCPASSRCVASSGCWGSGPPGRTGELPPPG